MSAETVNAETIDDRLLRFFKKELCKEGAYLLPLRLFIGMGWLRASAEKIVDPEARRYGPRSFPRRESSPGTTWASRSTAL